EVRLAICGLGLLSMLLVSLPMPAQQKTGPGVPADDSLSLYGITLYGVIDIGLQYDTHSAPFTPYRPAASGNIVRQNSRQSVLGLTPSNMGQSRVGLQGIEPLNEEWSATFQIETFFNPQSGQLADSVRSLIANNGKALTEQSVAVDGSSAAQYILSLDDQVHAAALYKFNGSDGSGRTAVQANVGGSLAGASIDAYYSKVKSSITASALSAVQVATL